MEKGDLLGADLLSFMETFLAETEYPPLLTGYPVIQTNVL